MTLQKRKNDENSLDHIFDTCHWNIFLWRQDDQRLTPMVESFSIFPLSPLLDQFKSEVLQFCFVSDCIFRNHKADVLFDHFPLISCFVVLYFVHPLFVKPFCPVHSYFLHPLHCCQSIHHRVPIVFLRPRPFLFKFKYRVICRFFCIMFTICFSPPNFPRIPFLYESSMAFFPTKPKSFCVISNKHFPMSGIYGRRTKPALMQPHWLKKFPKEKRVSD